MSLPEWFVRHRNAGLLPRRQGRTYDGAIFAIETEEEWFKELRMLSSQSHRIVDRIKKEAPLTFRDFREAVEGNLIRGANLREIMELIELIARTAYSAKAQKTEAAVEMVSIPPGDKPMTWFSWIEVD